MSKLTKALVLASVLWGAALCPIASVAQSVASSSPASVPRVEWPQDHSDIKADPDARFGRLPNGMTYVIYKNATPPGTLTIHLRIAAGSMMEDENQRGLAHLLEHLAFNGSRHIPEDQLLPLLERHGMKLGPDAEAYTLPQKTEYSLELPKNDADSIDTALFVLRETASELLIAPDALERERPVVLGEERLRDNPQLHAFKVWNEAAFPGQKYATRALPIGLVDVIKTAPRQLVVDFYHAFYRPELATLIVVGDVDVNAMEAKIKAKFGDWRDVGPAKPVDFGAYQPKGLKTVAYAEKSLQPNLSVTWFKPFDPHAQTARTELEELQDALLLSVLNRRLQHAAQQPQAAFVGAGAGQASIDQTAKLLQFTVVPKPGQDSAALMQAVGLLKQYVAYGVNADEIDQALKNFDSAFQTNAAGAKTRKNDAIAADIISNLDRNSIFTSPQRDLAVFEASRSAFTVEQLNVRLRVLFAGDGPLLSHTAEDLSGLDQTALQTTFAQAMAQPVTAYGAVATKPWPYVDFGPAQAPVAQRHYAAPAYTRYDFANGVKLNVMPTRFADNQIQVQVSFRGGWERFSPQTTAPVNFAAFYAGAGGMLAGGLGKLDQDELQKSLAGKVVGMSYGLGYDAATLSGTTTKADLPTQMQVLMAFATDAAFRSPPFDRLKTQLPTLYAQMAASPQGVYGRDASVITHGGDGRFAFPDLQQASGVTLDQIKAVVHTSLTDAPIEITIIGDVDEAQAVSEVGKTFATLPATPKTATIAPGGDHVVFPTADLVRVLHHQGRADQSLSVIAWPAPDYMSDTQRSRGLEVMTEILNQRLFDQVREKLGQAYDANASVDQSYVFKGFGLIGVSGSVTAGQDAVFNQAVEAIVADLQAKPVSQDELDRARKPLLDRWASRQKDNGHWMLVIPHLVEEPARLVSEQNRIAQLNAVSPADVQRLARTYLVPAKALHISVLPEPKPAAAKP